MKDKLNITIRIANQPPIPLTINRDEEEIIRRAEYNVNRLWTSWSERFNTSPGALLAMVAFQFAKLYATQTAERESAMVTLSEMEADLDRLISEGDAASKPYSGDDLVG